LFIQINIKSKRRYKMKKNLLIASLVISVLMISLVAAAWWPFESTGNSVKARERWGSAWCTTINPCPAGEGDCDKNSQCLTGYCARNVGHNYPEAVALLGEKNAKRWEVCECKGETVWDETSQTCVPEGELVLPGESLFEFSRNGADVIEVKVPITDGTATIALLKTNSAQNSFVIVGKDIDERLATSNTDTLVFYEERSDNNYDRYFVATDINSKKSYLLRARIRESDGANRTTIENLAYAEGVSSGRVICMEKVPGRSCHVDDVTLNIVEVFKNVTDRYVVIKAGDNVVFDRLYDTNRNHILLPVEERLPAGSYNFNIYAGYKVLGLYKATPEESSSGGGSGGGGSGGSTSLSESVAKLQEQVADLLSRVAVLETA
jgi:hypothetical protein